MMGEKEFVEASCFLVNSGWVLLGVLAASVVYGIVWFFKFSADKRSLQALTASMKEKEVAFEELSKKKENYHLRSAMQAHLARDLQSALFEVLEPLNLVLLQPSTDALLRDKLRTLHDKSLALKEIYQQLLALFEQEDYAHSLQVASYQANRISDVAIHSFRELLGTSHIHLVYTPSTSSLIVWVDYRKIEFVLCCLLSYAFRTTNYGGKIELSVAVQLLEGKPYCCFLITESGGDITAPNRNSVRLVEEIVYSHHGIVTADTLEGGGHAYRLYIPLGKAHFDDAVDIKFVTPETLQPILPPIVETPISAPTTDEVADKPKVVVIEDNEHIRIYLNLLLSKEFTVYMASNGKEGVEKVCQVMPDLILSDVMMPEMDGFECCKVLKENLDTCHIPILLLTALNDDKDVIHGLELGAEDYILKPFKPEILLSKVKRILQSRKELKDFYSKYVMPTLDIDVVDDKTLQMTQDPFIAKLLDTIALNLQNPEFSAKQLAEMVCMSQPTLYRKVKQFTGFTIVELIRGVRLKESAVLLKSKQYSIPEVAERVGYNDVPTFRKHFVELYGTTPSAFVKQHYLQNK